jgi:hypothetical protein
MLRPSRVRISSGIAACYLNIHFVLTKPTEAKYPHKYPYNESKKVKLEFPSECPPKMGENRQEFPLVNNGPYD